MGIQAVFWDIDGTMVMSEPVHDKKIEYIAGRHDISIPEEVLPLFYGTGDLRAYEILNELGMPGTVQQFLEECQAYYEAQLHLVDVREGFAGAFEYLDSLGVHQSAVSNGVKDLVRVNLDHAGVRPRLKVVVDLDYIRDAGLNPKPAADPYLDALRQVNESLGLSILPSQCLVVEDSPTGVAAGKAAGMLTVHWKLTSQRLASPLADHSAYTGAELMSILRFHCPAVRPAFSIPALEL